MIELFEREFLRNLYSGEEAGKRITDVEELLRRREEYRSANPTLPLDVSKARWGLKAEKDEPLITLLTFAALVKGSRKVWDILLKRCFPHINWDIEQERFELKLEFACTPKEDILKSLTGESTNHTVNYLRDIAEQKISQNVALERATNFDAILIIGRKKVFIECKFTSDISIDTTHCSERNQIARNIDVGMSLQNDNVDEFFFVMLTPKKYHQFPGSRLYYFKMEQYRSDPMAIALDIPRFYDWQEGVHNSKLERLKKHINFLSWETCVEFILKDNNWSADERAKIIKFYKERKLYSDLNSTI